LKIKRLEIDARTTPYVLSKGIDEAVKKLVRAMKNDMIDNRANLTGYTITLERTEDVPE